MMLRSTCTPGPPAEKSEGRFEETTRRPFTRLRVRLEPRPKVLTKLTPAPNDAWSPRGETLPRNWGSSLMASAVLVMLRSS
jgi:hypothetical protein